MAPISKALSCAAGTWDLAEYGPVYALAVGPYGAVLALSWNRDKEGQPTHVVWLDENKGVCREMSHKRHVSALQISETPMACVILGVVGCCPDVSWAWVQWARWRLHGQCQVCRRRMTWQ